MAGHPRGGSSGRISPGLHSSASGCMHAAPDGCIFATHSCWWGYFLTHSCRWGHFCSAFLPASPSFPGHWFDDQDRIHAGPAGNPCQIVDGQFQPNGISSVHRRYKTDHGQSNGRKDRFHSQFSGRLRNRTVTVADRQRLSGQATCSCFNVFAPRLSTPGGPNSSRFCTKTGADLPAERRALRLTGGSGQFSRNSATAILPEFSVPQEILLSPAFLSAAAPCPVLNVQRPGRRDSAAVPVPGRP